MKKILALVLGLLMLFSSAVVLGEVDLSGMNLEDLLQLRQDVDAAILTNNGAVILQAGDYIVGRDIAAGSYVISFYQNKSNHSYGKIIVYTSVDAMKTYDTALNDYQLQVGIIDSNIKNGIEVSLADKPEKFDYSKYIVTNIYERFAVGSSYRVTLEEGQVLHIENNTNDMYCTIEQAKGLFMN